MPSFSTPTLYGIKNCDSVKKARKWLEANASDYKFHDFRADGLEKKQVELWLEQVDWNVLLNRRSTSWKQLSDKQRDGVSANNVADLLVATPTLIKRPVMEHGDKILVGFKETEYKATIT